MNQTSSDVHSNWYLSIVTMSPIVANLSRGLLHGAVARAKAARDVPLQDTADLPGSP